MRSEATRAALAAVVVMMDTFDRLAVSITDRLLQLALLAEALRDEASVSSFTVTHKLVVQVIHLPIQALEKEAVDSVVAEMSPRIRVGVSLLDERGSDQNVTAGRISAEDIHDVVFEVTKVQETSEVVQADVLADQVLGLQFVVCGDGSQLVAVKVVCEELEGFGGAALADVPDSFGSEIFHGQGRNEFVPEDVVGSSLLSNDETDHQVRVGTSGVHHERYA